MHVFLSILILICALLLIGVILIQKSKGGGLASNFQGANQIMGVKSATNFVEKATWVLAVIICILSIISAFTAPQTLVQGQSKVSAPAKQEVAVPFTEQTDKNADAKEMPAPAAKPAETPAEAPATPAK